MMWDKEGDVVGRIKRKQKRILVFIALLLMAVIWGGSRIISELPYRNLTAAEVVSQGIDKIKLGKSYSFTMQAKEIKEGQEKQLADLKGDVCQGNAQIAGNLPFINAEINLVRVGNDLYRKDSISDRWFKIPVADMESAEEFMMEINPLSIFENMENVQVNYVGKEKVEGRRCRVYEVMTKGEREWMTYFWQDYNYRIWIDQKEGYLKKGEVYAEHRDNSKHQMYLLVIVDDYGKNIDIKAPI